LCAGQDDDFEDFYQKGSLKSNFKHGQSGESASINSYLTFKTWKVLIT
jgi:hypothetical protein